MKKVITVLMAVIVACGIFSCSDNPIDYECDEVKVMIDFIGGAGVYAKDVIIMPSEAMQINGVDTSGISETSGLNFPKHIYFVPGSYVDISFVIDSAIFLGISKNCDTCFYT